MPRHIKSHDNAIYFVKCDFGRAGVAFVERSGGDWDRATTIRDIASNEWRATVVEVLEVIPGEHIANVVTEEILRAAGMWEEEAPSPVDLRAIRWDHERDSRKHSEVV